jgi:hypothetical protein
LHLGGVVKALRGPEARDELAHFAWFKRMEVSTHTPPKACGQRAAEIRDVLQAVGRRQKAPPRAGRMRSQDEGCEGKVSAGNAVRRQAGGVKWSNYLQISPHAERRRRAVEEAWRL